MYRGTFKFCRVCQKKIISCTSCDSRKIYCSPSCSRAARLKSKRQSNRKNSKLKSSKRKQSRRQNRYRARLRLKRVTGHSSPSKSPELLPEVSSFTESPKTPLQPEALRNPRPCCHYCGRGPLWLPATSEGQHFEDSS